jgi:hypothetical protein
MECRRNAREDAREYAIRFPRRLPYPNYNVFLRLVHRARDTGSLVPNWQEISGSLREVRTPETEDAVLQSFDDDSRRSILEELNDHIHETLATVISNVLRLAREHLIKRARLFLQMKGGLFILHVSYFICCILHRLVIKFDLKFLLIMMLK